MTPVFAEQVRRSRHRIRNLPLVGDGLASGHVRLARRRFESSAGYWERRYLRGGTSGDGSRGELAAFKAAVLNDIMKTRSIGSVIEFGCGDGNQLELATYSSYLGFDVSESAVRICRRKFESDPNKTFDLLRSYAGETADAALSIDVVYHLVEDDIFEEHMGALFGAAVRVVVVYSTNTGVQAPQQPPHVHHRCFTRWAAANAPEWSLARVVENMWPHDPVTGTGSQSEFYVYERAAIP